MGAPKGNTNALKHGLYAKHFSLEEQVGLRRMSPEDFRHEIYMMRVTINKMFDLHGRLLEIVEKSMAIGKPSNMEALASITNSMSLAITALNTTARTYALFNGADTALNDTFGEALNSLAIFLDDSYLTESNEDVDGVGEILTIA